METNLKNYDTRTSWIPQQNQLYEGRVLTSQDGRQQLTQPQNQGLPQRGVGQKPKVPEKMPKARVLALANTFKRWLAIASIVGFGTFSGLVALHQVGTTATTSQTSSTSSQTSSSQNNNSFFNQGGNNFGTSNSSQGSTSASSSSSSTPVTATSVS